jgi:ketosteroid isomerase-like protein
LLFVKKTFQDRKMTEHSLWRFSRAFYRALNERQTDQLESILDDNIDWAIYGPIDMFAFLGARHGKRAVIDVVREISSLVQLHRFDRESLMLGEESAASLMRYSLTPSKSGNPISVRVALFAQFKGNKLTSLRAVVDTFDLVEQVLGRQIHLPQIA